MTTTLPTVDGKPRKTLDLLRERAFRRYWFGQTISLFGDQISALALPVLAVLATQAGPAEMGYLTAAGLVPNLLFSLFAGAWADRRPDKRRIMIVADIGRAVLLLAIPALYVMDVLSMTQLYAVAFGVGTLSVLFEVCRSTLFVSLIGKDDYIAANSLLNGARALSYVGGPSLGGLLIAVLTAPFALVADAISFLFSGVLLASIKPVEPPPSATKGLGLGEGMRFLWRTTVLRTMLASTTVLNLFNYMFSALIVLYAVSYLHFSPAILGLVIGVASIGALIGAAITGRVVARIGVGPSLILGSVLFPAPLIAIPLVTGGSTTSLYVLFAVVEFFSGIGVMILDIAAGSIQAAVIPDDLRARVTGAFRTVNYGIRPIGAVLGGTLGAAMGVRGGLWVATVGAVLCVVFLLFSPVPRMKRL
jgi:MFS family permease